MSVVPRKPIEKVQFYEAHLTPWNTNSTAIGLVAAEVTDLETKTTAARAAFDTHVASQQASKAATQAFHDAVDAMADAGSALIKKIRAKAEQTGGNSVYNLAEIPPPAIPAPRGLPGTPAELKVELDGNGALILTWKCDNPAGAQGTIYHVYRRIGGSGEFAFLGGAGQKKFIDGTVPAGATALTYQIQAVRSTTVGMWATFNVFFGTNSSGMMMASVTETDAPKIAA